ncbi:MAG: M15 family metallopeptidase [Micromonosporaceae bacterium]|nr:M15 family metallopeptidase [Micromonosporaceae bacterium]
MQKAGRATVSLLAAVITCSAIVACSSGDSDGQASGPRSGPSGSVTAPSPAVTRIGAATAAPEWLGTRPLPTGSDGFAQAQKTPPELRERSIITVDDLPPPADGRFHATVEKVPAGVLARSTWTDRCPVSQAQLRYLTVSFRGFDGLAHTGELLVNERVADDLVAVFEQLFAEGFPIERMRVVSTAELNAPPTGDTNTTTSFACRGTRGQTSWSQHAYGLAVDINPFHNPYRKGDTVLPELATAYLDRATPRAGMVAPAGPVVRAFASIGWQWGGNYRSLKDYMHFSANGK